MTTPSPLRALHAQAEAAFTAAPAGPAPIGAPAADAPAVELVESFGDPESELRALREGCAVLDLPHRATIRVAGAERVPFLNRMLTQELKGLAAFQSRRAFWLNRKGRIDADLRLVELGESILLDVDIRAAARLVSTLDAFIIADDVALADESARRHRLALHGPRALAALAAVATHTAGAPLTDLSPGAACVVTIAGKPVIAERCDTAGVPGLELAMAADDAPAVYHQLLELGSNGDHAVRPIGWTAFNAARIAAGEPIYLVDFGTESLPAESGALPSRVSFTKGCYLGQEIVARMHSLGHPRQRAVQLRLDAPGTAAPGDRILPDGKPDADAVGFVTSASRLTPSVCLAQVKYAHSSAGSRLVVQTAEGPRPAAAQPLPL